MKVRTASLILSSILSLSSVPSRANSRIINGVPVPKGMFSEVIEVKSNGSSCTATVVGPNVLVVAAHCVSDGGKVDFAVGNQSYTGEAVRHPSYPGKDIDVALVVSSDTIAGIAPASLGSTVAVGDKVFLLGFGCTTEGGGGGNDGVLRMGESDVVGLQASDFVSRRASGGALCFGDSGGPTMAKEAGKFRVVGVNSKGNIKDTNYSTHLALPIVQQFFKATAAQYAVEICGVTMNCEGLTPFQPHFKKSAYIYSMQGGDSATHKLSAWLDSPISGVTFHLDPSAPDWMLIQNDTLTLAPPKTVVGSFRVSITAKGQAGADATLISVNVNGPVATPPSCVVTATPPFVRLGESIVLAMQNVGDVSSAVLNGKSMPITGGKLIITPAESGVFTSTGVVSGPGGSSTCSVRFGVK